MLLILHFKKIINFSGIYADFYSTTCGRKRQDVLHFHCYNRELKNEAVVTCKPLSMNLCGIPSWPNYDKHLLFSIFCYNSIFKIRIDQKITPLGDHLVERFILYKLLEQFLCFVRLKK